MEKDKKKSISEKESRGGKRGKPAERRVFASSPLFRRFSIFFNFLSFVVYGSLSPSLSLSFYPSPTLAVAVTLPGSKETANNSARLLASAKGAPPHPAGHDASAAAALSNSASDEGEEGSELLPLRLKAGRAFPPTKTRCPPLAIFAGGPQ